MRRDCITVDDFRRRAQHVLPRRVFDFIDGGAGDEGTLRRNTDAFAAWRFTARRFCGVDRADPSTSLLSRTLTAPLVIGPTRLNGLLWPDGDLAIARAARDSGIPFVLSTVAQHTIERVADAAGGDLWFQLYVTEPPVTEELVDRADRAGYRALVVTVDVPANGQRNRDRRNRFELPLRWSATTAIDAMRHPRWLFRFLRSGRHALANVDPRASPAHAGAAQQLRDRRLGRGVTWQSLADLRARWPRRLVVKGILDIDDALKCFDLGVDAVILSNHGGRQMECFESPLAVLPAIASRTRGPLLVDGGIRRGSDIVKAVALGAAAGCVGRAVLYGLAVGGQRGVRDVISALQSEIADTLVQIGCGRLNELDRRLIVNSLDTRRDLALFAR